METMQVRVTGSDHHKWYKDKIGQIFTVKVKPHQYGLHELDVASYPDLSSYGIMPEHFEIIVEDKIVEHEGIKYEVPSWVKFLTRESADTDVVGFEFKPTWSDCDGGFEAPMWHNTIGGMGRVIMNVKPYEAPKPEGNFIKEV